MAASGARPPARGTSPSSQGPDLTHKEAAVNIRLVARRAETGRHSARMPFLAYLINVALEEANNEKTKG